jgi:hypothetical protein
MISGKLYQVSGIGLPTDVADTLFVHGADAGPIPTGNSFGGINRFLLFRRLAAPTAEEALLWNLSAATRTRDRRDHFTAMRAFHSFLLKMEISNKPFNIPFVPLYLVKESPGRFIRKKPVEVALFPGKERIEVNLPSLFFFWYTFYGFFVSFIHKKSPFYIG